MSNISKREILKEYSRELRNNSTLGEILLWKKVLRAKKFHGYQFNRQFIINNYVVDFVCRKLKLIIEIDGYSHQFKYQKDRKREQYLEELGYSILRFSESEVKHSIDDVVWKLEKFLEDN